MDIAKLAQHGFPQTIVDAWRSGVKRLHPLQKKAQLETDLLNGGNLIVLAPTGAGNSACAAGNSSATARTSAG